MNFDTNMTLDSCPTRKLEVLLVQLRKLSKKVNSFWFNTVQVKIFRKRHSGICGMIADQNGNNIWSYELTVLFKAWEKFSGIVLYPVPSISADLSPIDAYRSNPRWTGEYGELRRELLQHCIDTLDAKLKARQPFAK